MRLIEETFRRALDAIQMRVFSKGGLAVAFSGGPDSTALLRLARQYAADAGIPLWAFHIHHGISSNADDWLVHCRQVCQDLGVGFDALKVQVDGRTGDGIEADARKKRYQALGSLCRQHDVTLLLTGHHQDDQLETVLMQLLRGTGLAGLAGMGESTVLPYQTEGQPVLLGRPLLNISRRELEGWLEQAGEAYVEDESNSDIAYTRNAIRHRLMPLLSEISPGFERHLAGTAAHAASALRLLDALAETDLHDCQMMDGALDMAKVRTFGQDRIDNLLRHWLDVHQVRIPSAAWFRELRKQLLSENRDVKTTLVMDGKTIRRYRDRVTMTGQSTRQPPEKAIAFNWNGEPSIQFRTWYGTLVFELGETGFDVDWFRGRIFTLRPYQGNARIRLTGRPSKDLKSLYQEAGVPGADRRFLPAVWWEEELVFAAGIGQAAQYQGNSGRCVQLKWLADPVTAG